MPDVNILYANIPTTPALPPLGVGQNAPLPAAPPRRATVAKPKRPEQNLSGWYFNGDVVAAGIVTAKDMAAFRHHRKALRAAWRRKTPTTGVADIRALHVGVRLHYSLPEFDRIPESSLRYWWLLATHDQDWATLRSDKRLRNRERKAKALSEAAYGLTRAKAAYRPYSSFQMVLKRLVKHPKGEEEIRVARLDRAARLSCLLECRAAWKIALRKVLAALADYRAVAGQPD
jgi:hypothetical protein